MSDANENQASALAQSLGPPPFRFEPAAPTVSCRAYTLPFRGLTLALVGGCAFWMFRLWHSGQFATSQTSGIVWLLSGLALMLFTAWHIQTSRTTLTAQALHQSWMWDKQMELRELAYVKLIRVPGLDWLIAPRLYARTLLGKFAVFYAADAQMIAEFERLRDELKAFRGF